MKESLEAYGVTDRWRQLYAAVVPEGEEGERWSLGRVVVQDRGFVQVLTEAGVGLFSIRANRTGVAVVGDWVAVDHETVRAVLDRTSLLSRQDPRADIEQPLVANVDDVFIVTAADQSLQAGRIERAVTQTRNANATPTIVLSKADFADAAAERARDLKQRIPSIEVIAVSAQGGNNLDEIRRAIVGRTAVMIGESGAGKSTLLNSLLGDEVMDTAEVRERDSKGRHTTTRRELHLVPSGGMLIDTPGLRTLGLWAGEDSIDETFPDIAELATLCKFSDCAHSGEPGCALALAIEEGRVAEDRVASFKSFVEESRATEVRLTEHEWRKKDRKFGKAVDEPVKHKGKR